MNIVLGELQKLMLSIFAVGILAVISAIFLLRSVTNFITRPLIELTSTVNEISNGNYTIRADTNTPNEIGQLAATVNSMAANTLNLLERIEKEEALKRQFELSYIQLQMNPHFLYNTLESLCGMIAVDEKKKAIRMIQKLSSFYRKVLSRGTPIVTMQQELEITQCYLDILQQRYCEIYTYDIQIDPAAKSYHFPKLTLQPFVENALIHGILPTCEPGELTISIYFQGEHLLISIADNGQGMPEEVLHNLRTALKERDFSAETGFGIINTVHRLSLFLNEPDIDVQIDSDTDHGTSIRLILPAVQHDIRPDFYTTYTQH